MGTWAKRVLSRGKDQCKGPEAGQYPVSLWNSEEAPVAGAEGLREGAEMRQGGDKDIVCRAVGRTWAFGMNEMGAMECSEQRRD